MPMVKSFYVNRDARSRTLIGNLQVAETRRSHSPQQEMKRHACILSDRFFEEPPSKCDISVGGMQEDVSPPAILDTDP